MSPRVVKNVSYDYTGQVAVISGASRGIGRAHALAFGRAGAKVVVSDLGPKTVEGVPYQLGTSDDIDSVVAEINAAGGTAMGAACDVRDSAGVAAMMSQVVAEYGQIDILINNAGVESVYDVQDLPDEAWDAMIDTHLKGTFLMSKAAAQHMIARGEGGKIVITGSTSSLRSMPRQAHYTAAKHGIIGLAKGMAIDLAPHRINVNVVCPGGVATPMGVGLKASMNETVRSEWAAFIGQSNFLTPGELLDPEEITHAMLWLASDAAAFVTAATLVVDAGFTIR